MVDKGKLPDHIEWLVKSRGEELLAALHANGFEFDIIDAIKVFIAADPSEKKGAVDWLVNTYIEDGFLWEDIEAGNNSKVNRTLELFAINRKKLDGEFRNLSAYFQLSGVYEKIRAWDVRVEEESSSARLIRKQERAIVMDSSRILFKNEQCIIAVPLTEEASKWWGKGTQWCTASTRSDNYFDEYNCKAPLVVAVFPQGLKNGENTFKKFQIWVEPWKEKQSAQVYFMDENDAPVTPEFVKTYWKKFKPLLEWAFIINPRAIYWMPEKSIHGEELNGLVKNKAIGLHDIPGRFLNNEICLLGLENDPNSFRSIPKHLIDQNIIDHVPAHIVAKNIHKVESAFQTTEICKLALINSFNNINFCNPEFINEQLIYNDLSKDNYSGCLQDVLDFIKKNDQYISERILKYIVTKNPVSIKNIPQDFLTQEMCEIALDRSSASIQWIPIKFMNREMIEILVMKVPEYIKKVPENLLDEDLVRIAARSRWNFPQDWNWNWLPQKFQTLDIWRSILERDEKQITWLPTKFLKLNLFSDIFDKNPRIIQFFPLKASEDQWKKTVLDHPDLLKEMPEQFHSVEIYLNCLKIRPAENTWRYFKPDIITQELAEVMIQISLNALIKIPKSLHTVEWGLQYIRNPYITAKPGFLDSSIFDQVMKIIAADKQEEPRELTNPFRQFSGETEEVKKIRGIEWNPEILDGLEERMRDQMCVENKETNLLENI